jgi:hypothetical protein
MNIIYLNKRYIEMLRVYKQVNLENPFSVDALTELFNTKDLSIIRKETEMFISALPVNYSKIFEIHEVFDNVLIEYDIEPSGNRTVSGIAFAPLNDKGLIAYDDCCCTETSLINALDKIYTAEEIIGTPIWSRITNK